MKFFTKNRVSKPAEVQAGVRTSDIPETLFVEVRTAINELIALLNPSGSNGKMDAFQKGLNAILRRFNVSEEQWRHAVSVRSGRTAKAAASAAG